jgi:ABC-type Mn2+/Zn2+ transport system ATPase subunit
MSREVSDLGAELIRFDSVALGYGRRRILEKVDLAVSAGDYLGIVGANGAGKTTLLRGLLGLIQPQRGQVSRAPKLRYGYVPQLQTVEELFPFTVHDVVLMGRYGQIGALRRPSRADSERARAALEEVGIAMHAEQLYRDLSGGQKQRTLIARALACDPQVLVLDEHTNDLDIVSERAIMALIDQLHANHAMAVIMVSHSLNTVANHARSIGIINNATFQLAPVEEVLRPDYLEKIYGVPLRVAEVEGIKVVL